MIFNIWYPIRRGLPVQVRRAGRLCECERLVRRHRALPLGRRRGLPPMLRSDETARRNSSHALPDLCALVLCFRCLCLQVSGRRLTALIVVVVRLECCLTTIFMERSDTTTAVHEYSSVTILLKKIVVYNNTTIFVGTSVIKKIVVNNTTTILVTTTVHKNSSKTILLLIL